jgi:hypothetical protein
MSAFKISYVFKHTGNKVEVKQILHTGRATTVSKLNSVRSAITLRIGTVTPDAGIISQVP